MTATAMTIFLVRREDGILGLEDIWRSRGQCLGRSHFGLWWEKAKFYFLNQEGGFTWKEKIKVKTRWNDHNAPLQSEQMLEKRRSIKVQGKVDVR